MAMEQYPQGTEVRHDLSEDDVSLKKWNSSAIDESGTNSSSGFECNICLDLVQDPVVTFCGHLYCWPCIYRWINFRDDTEENLDQWQPQCPVCKANVSLKTLIPLYGRGQHTSRDENSRLGLHIPQRPSSPRCGGDTLTPCVTINHLSPGPQRLPYRQSHVTSSRYMARPAFGIGGGSFHMVDPMIGMFGDIVRLFGNSQTSLYAYPNSYNLGGGNSPRLRRQLMQSDESLSRVCLFLCCCVMLCLLLF